MAFSSASAMNFGYSLGNIELLNGSNFKTWKDHVELYLGLQGVDICLREDAPVLADNSNAAAVYFTKNNKRSTNSKHIDLKYYSVRERVKHKELGVIKINTLNQLADPFTKPLTIKMFEAHTKSIGILPTLDTEI